MSKKNKRICMTVSRVSNPKTGGEKSIWHWHQGLVDEAAFEYQVIDFEKAPRWIHVWRGRADSIFFVMINVWYCYQVFKYKPDVFIEDHYFARHCFLLNFLSPLVKKMSLFFSVREITNLHKKKKTFHCKAFQLGLQRAHTIIANSQVTEEDLERYTMLKGRSHVIYPGFDRHSYLDFKRSWGANPVILLFAGVVRPLKELDLVVRALARMTMIQKPDWVLNVAGRYDADPEYFSNLQVDIERLGLSQNVHFLGMLDRAELESIYQKAEIFVLPSRNEAFGQVFLEAMSWKLPIIASKSGGVVEIVAQSGGGLLLPVGEVDAWSRGIETLLLDRTLRQEMGEKSFERSKDFGGWQGMVDQFITLIKQRG